MELIKSFSSSDVNEDLKTQYEPYINNFVYGIKYGLPTNWEFSNFPNVWYFWLQVIFLIACPTIFFYETILWTWIIFSYQNRPKKNQEGNSKDSSKPTQKNTLQTQKNTLLYARTKVLPRLLSSRIILGILYFWWQHVFEDNILYNTFSRDIIETPFEMLVFIFYTLDLVQKMNKKTIVQRITFVTNKTSFFLGLSLVPYLLSYISLSLEYAYFVGILTLLTSKDFFSKSQSELKNSDDPELNLEEKTEYLITSLFDKIWVYSHKYIKNK